MEKIASFKVDHLKLKKGLYVSRKDVQGECVVTTFDLRLTEPNVEPAMGTAALHTIEHLGATYLRNHERGGEIVYFGPMGCRTGFYLIMFGDLAPQDVAGLVTDMCDYILCYEGEIPGAKPSECGNWRDQNLDMAKYHIRRYKTALLTEKNYTYAQ